MLEMRFWLSQSMFGELSMPRFLSRSTRNRPVVAPGPCNNSCLPKIVKFLRYRTKIQSRLRNEACRYPYAAQQNQIDKSNRSLRERLLALQGENRSYLRIDCSGEMICRQKPIDNTRRNAYIRFKEILNTWRRRRRQLITQRF